MDKLHELFNKAMEIADECGIKYGTIAEINVNPRIYSTMARVKMHPYYNCSGYFYTIEVSKNALEKCNNDFLINCILHEIVHTCSGCWNHGREFKRVGMEITRRYPQYKIERTGDAQAACKNGVRYNPIEPKYILKCDECGKEFTYQRMCKPVKYVARYRCNCGGKLTRIK